jgi:phenylacetyl-CoA:acceptor oxidoreductase subunit 1
VTDATAHQNEKLTDMAGTQENTPRWGMVVDVNRCVGCQTCTIACKHWNDTQPGVQWRKVLDVETGTFPDVERVFLVVGCQHCAEPPCVPVCPTGATKQRADGLVTQDYDICIGCAYCAVSCPYQARTIAHHHSWYYGEETAQEDRVRHAEREGVVQKCTFCVDKVDDAYARGLTPGVDLEVTPACSAACIAQAITFGDYNDPESNVSQLTRDNPYFQMHAELGTDPQIKYLYTTPSVPGRELAAEEHDDERMADPANPLVGTRQTMWDWRAAMNWCFGGLSSGFALVTWILHLIGVLPAAGLAYTNVLAGALMAVGLFFVWLKIGKKFRAWRAIARPQTSWMTRELYMAAVFYPAVLAGLVFQHEVAFAVAGLAAAAFLVCQAKILHMAKGIPAWRVPLIPWMIIATGLYEGAALALPVTAVAVSATGGVPYFERWWGLFLVLAVLSMVAAALWAGYLRTAKARGIPPLSRRVLWRFTPWLQGFGYAIPFVIFVAATAAMLMQANDVPPTMLTIVMVGLSLVVAVPLAILFGLGWKFVVVARAGYHQGYALGKLPQRGSGKKAAPAKGGARSGLRAAAAE